MRKYLKKFVIASLFLIPTILESCLPEPPEPLPPHTYRKTGPLNGRLGEDGKLAPGSGHPCPDAGQNCILINNPPPHSTSNRILLEEKVNEFKFYLDNNNLSSYFTNKSSYETLFPSLVNGEAASDVKQLLIDGTYKASMLDDRTIAIYKNNSVSDENIIFMVFVNYDNI